jgi:2-keto-4-pentenoate hydratase
MNQQDIHAAAAILWQHWQQSTRLDELPAQCRPGSRAEGYAIQAEVAKLSGQSIVGWKIAATSTAGQQHIRVDGPWPVACFRHAHSTAVRAYPWLAII